MGELKDRKLFAWHVAKNIMSIMLQALKKGGNGVTKVNSMKQARERFNRMMKKPVPHLSAEEQERALEELKRKYVKGVVTTSGLIDDTF